MLKKKKKSTETKKIPLTLKERITFTKKSHKTISDSVRRMLQYLTTQSNIDLTNKAAGSGVDKKNKYTVYINLLIHPFILVMLFANVADVMLHSSKHDHVLTFRDEFLSSNY